MSENLLVVGLSNAIVATGLAIIVLAVTRFWRHAALAHLLWMVVLVKLVTPPIFDLKISIPVPHDSTVAVATDSSRSMPPTDVDHADIDSKFEERFALQNETSRVGSNGELVATHDLPNYLAMDEVMASDSVFAIEQAQATVTDTPGPTRLEDQSALVNITAAWRKWSGVLAAVWLTGSLMMAAVALLRLYRFRRLIRRAAIATREVRDEVASVLEKTRVRSAPDVRVTGARIVPLIFSMGQRSVLLLPESLWSSFSREERSTVLAHELAHLHRRDHWCTWFELIVVVLYWWYPLTWFACRQLRSAADECCDGWVVRWFPDKATPYAESMMKSLDFMAEGTQCLPTLASGFGQFNSLKRRFEMVLNNQTCFRMTTVPRIAVCFVATIVLVISPFLVLGETPPETELSSGVAAKASESSAPREGDKTANARPPKPGRGVIAAADKTGALREAGNVRKQRTTSKKATDTFRFQGRVEAPDGKPVVAAKIFLYRPFPTSTVELARTKGNGEFAFEVQPSNKLHSRFSEGGGIFVAVADSFGIALKSAHECETTGALARIFQQRFAASGASAALAADFLKRITTGSSTFHLTSDDLPISGRVIDIEGMPVFGAKIHVCNISDAGQDGLDAWEKAAKAPNADRYSVSRTLGITLGNDVGGDILEFVMPAKTDKNGDFRLEGIGRDRVVKLLISGPGIDTAEVFARTRDGDAITIDKEPGNPSRGQNVYHPASFTHVGGPSEPVIGSVVDAKSKEPLADVTIQSYRLAGRRMSGWTEGIVRTKTDSEGRFRLEGLPVGDNELIVLSRIDEPYIVSNRSVKTKSGEEPLKLDIELTRGLWIHGRVFDVATGQPIRSGSVGYFAFTKNEHAQRVKGFNGGMLSTRYRLNPDGTYRIPGLPGRGIVGVMAERDHDRYQRGVGADKIDGLDENLNGFHTYPFILSSFNYHMLVGVNPADDADSVNVDFPLSSGKTLRVTVVDSDGNPVPGCQYTGKLEFNAWRQSAGNELEIVGYRSEKPRRVQVLHKGRKLAGLILIEGNVRDKLTVALQPWAEIKGRIVDETGAPKANVEIRDMFGFDDSRVGPDMAGLPPSEGSQIGRYYTDDEGRFNIAGLMPGYKFGMHVSYDRYFLGDVRPDEVLKPGEVHELGDLELNSRENK